MRIRSEELKKLADRAGMSSVQLAEAVARTGLEGPKAEKAVNNWMAGRDHPRCKAPDIRRLAQTLGCAVSDIARFESSVEYHRGSTQKARLVVDMIRGRTLADADQILKFTHKRAAVNVRKALQTAASDADQAGANLNALVVAEITVDEGPVIKRFKAKDRGRAHPILKQTSHITIGVEERN
jgi:large subunit ribosomal protein L22